MPKCDLCERKATKDELEVFATPLSSVGNMPRCCPTCHKNLVRLINEPFTKKREAAEKAAAREEKTE